MPRRWLAFVLLAAPTACGTQQTSGPLVKAPTAPTAVTATAGDAQATVSWTAPSDDGGAPITSYTVITAPGGDKTHVTAPTTTTTISGLTDGTTYTFTVIATNSAGDSPSSDPSNAVTPSAGATVPTAPTLVTATAGDGQATVTWTAPTDDGGSAITSYTVTASPGGATATVTAPTATATVTGLTNGTSYTFTVVATNAVGDSPASTSSNAVAPAAASTTPAAPTAVNATAGDGQATISWTAPTNDGGSAITSYTVTATPGGATATVSAPTTNATVTGLANGTSYTFTVVATNAVGDSAPSAASNSVTPTAGTTTVPAAPTGVTATPGNTQATVSWTAPVTDGGSALLSYTVTPSPSGTPVTIAAPASSVTVTGLTNGTGYTFSVVATNAIGDSLPAVSPAVTPGGVPDAPTAVSATAGDGQATVSWVPPTNNGGSPITGYTITASPGGITATAGSAETSAIVSGLTNGTAYTFTVVATNAIGDSTPSTPSSSVTPATMPGAPTNVIASAGANGIVTISWTAPADDGGSAITGYTVYASPGTRYGTTYGSTTLYMNALQHQSYTFTVVATNAVGDGPASAPSNAVTPIAVPDAPTNVTATAGNASATVSWTTPANDNGSAITQYVIEELQTYTTTTINAPATSGTFPGLSHQSYTFLVYAVNAAGYSSPSAASNAVTPTTVPAAPTGITAAAGLGQVFLSWTAPNDGGDAITGYTITIDDGSGTTTTTVTGTSTTLSALTADTTYSFTIVATNSLGDGPASTAASATPYGPPDATASTLLATPPMAFASGDSPITVTLYVRDASGIPVAGEAVGFASTEATDMFTTSASGTTNAGGFVATRLTGTVVGSRTITASFGTTSKTVSVQLVAGCTSSSFSVVTATPAVGGGPNDLVTGDFDADGELDLAVLNSWDNSISLLGGKGDGTFKSATNVSLPTDIDAEGATLVRGDFNGDGAIDLAAGELSIYGYFVNTTLGAGNGAFGTSIQTQVSSSSATGNGIALASADFDGDGLDDIAAVSTTISSEVLNILLSNGDGTFRVSSATTLESTYSTSSSVAVVAADFDDDGIVDLVATNPESGGVHVLLGNGDGTFGNQQDYSTSYPDSAFAGDFDGDGEVDFATAEGYLGTDVEVLFGNGNGTLQNAVTFSTGPTGTEPFSTWGDDLDGDGTLDLMVVNEARDASSGNFLDTASVLLNDASNPGTFQAPLSLATGTQPSAVVSGDFNDDGKPDLAITNTGDSTVTIYLNTCN